jgi:hypothetical protein
MPNPTIPDLITAMKAMQRKYAMAIIATNDARSGCQANERLRSEMLKAAITSAEGLIKTGHTLAAFEFLGRFLDPVLPDPDTHDRNI